MPAAVSSRIRTTAQSISGWSLRTALTSSNGIEMRWRVVSARDVGGADAAVEEGKLAEERARAQDGDDRLAPVGCPCGDRHPAREDDVELIGDLSSAADDLSAPEPVELRSAAQLLEDVGGQGAEQIALVESRA